MVSSAYLARVNDQMDTAIGELTPPPTVLDAYPEQAALWEQAAAAVAKLKPALESAARDIHAQPEVAFEETYAQQRLVALLSDFDVELGAHGLETAFRATWSTPEFDPAEHPTIALLSEYDALPGIGHACGHNLIGTAGVGGFLGAVAALQDSDFQGRLVLFGTPAEEGRAGKELMIRSGMLAGIDAAAMIHPFSYDIGSHVWVGRRTLHATFRGVSAHASSEPFMGRNALDAVTLAYQGIGLMRQQMPPSDRVHAVIPTGGERPSIIPDAASLLLNVRSLYPETLLELSARVSEILEGAALMAGVSVELDWDPDPATLPVRNNEAMVSRWALTQSRRGRAAIPAGVIPATLAASTDFGNVSHLVPGIHPMVKIAPVGVALHTAELREAAASEDGMVALEDAAVGLAQVAVDLIADPALLAATRAEFAESGGAVTTAELFGG
ncbi:M20 family metallopeptidase [Corynebacterium sp. H127]|uniref:M20 family metallopeptidase n=1 Tax=Corynebacterium sp. H127 TaxID=3133418 RepID=UPI0030AF300C